MFFTYKFNKIKNHKVNLKLITFFAEVKIVLRNL